MRRLLFLLLLALPLHAQVSVGGGAIIVGGNGSAGGAITGTTTLNYLPVGTGASSIGPSTTSDDGTTITVRDTSGIISPKYTVGTVGSGNYCILSLSDTIGALANLQCATATYGGTTIDASGVYSQNVEGTYGQFGNFLFSGTGTVGTFQNGVSGNPIIFNQNGGGPLTIQVNGAAAISGAIQLSNGFGSSGQVITSQGSGSPAVWAAGGGGGSVNGATITPGIVNGVVSGSGIAGSGIGVGQSAWSGSTAYAQCTAVSHSSLNYIGVVGSTGVTPGTNSAVWYPVPNANTPTAADCAFYIAASMVSGTTGAELLLPPGNSNTCIGFLEPTVTTPGNPVVSIFGAGKKNSVLTQTCSISAAVITQPDSGVDFAFAELDLEGFTVNANWNAPADINIYGAQQFPLRHLVLENPADGSDHYIEFGHTSGSNHNRAWTYEMYLDDIDTLNGHAPGSGAAFTVTSSGGTLTFAVTNGGSNYNATYTQIVLSGTGANADVPCTTRGTDTITVVSGAITAVTSTASGCAATINATAFGGNRVTYGFKFNDASDSKTLNALTPSEANTGIWASNITSQMSFTKAHPISTYTGILDQGNNSFFGTQIDSVYRYGFDFQGATNIESVYGTDFEYSNYVPGATDYHFGKITGSPSTAPYQINISGGICGGAPSFGGYYHYITPSGGGNTYLPTFVHPSEDTSCDQLASNANAVNYYGPWASSGSVTAGGNLVGLNGVANIVSQNQNKLQLQFNTFTALGLATSNGQILFDDLAGDVDVVWQGSHNLRFGVASSPTSGIFNSFGIFSLSSTLNLPDAIVASGSTIAPTTPMVEITGTTTINTITRQTGWTSGCFNMLTENIVTFGTSGNIQTGLTSVANTPYVVCYWPVLSKWTISAAGGGGSSGISGLTAGYLPIAGSATTITANSHLDDGVTTASTITSTEPIAVTGPSTGIHGGGTQTFTAGSTTIIGTGGSYSAPACVSSVQCDSFGGSVAFTTGGSISAAGVIFTITMPQTRINVPSCTVNIKGGTAALGEWVTASVSSNIVTLSVGSNVALANNTAYQANLGVCNGN